MKKLELKHLSPYLPYFESLLLDTGAMYDFDAFTYDLQRGEIYYKFIERLLENHFDVFGLINEGLAIDINTFPLQNLSNK